MSYGAIPRTNVANLCAQIQTLITHSGKYLARNNFEVRKLLRDCERLRVADAFDGAVALIFMAEAFGDVEEARQLTRQVKALFPEIWHEAEFQFAQTCVGLGYFSDAQSIFKNVGSPEIGLFTNRLQFGMICGAASQVCDFIAQARLMKIALDEDMVLSAQAAYSVYEKTATTDDDAGCLLDLAGEVMRDHRLLPLGNSPKVATIDHPELTTNFMEIIVKAPIEEVGVMNLELADLVAHRLSSVPHGVTVMFSGLRS